MRYGSVSTHSHPKVAGGCPRFAVHAGAVSTHSHPKVAGVARLKTLTGWPVSTHSHPKVAGHTFPAGWPFARRFNTQPPEGGWGGGNQPR